MTRINATAFLFLVVAACTDTTPTDTTTAELVGSHCGAYVPPERPWNGTAYPAPYGKATLVLRAVPKNNNAVMAFFIDRNTDAIYDQVRVSRQDVGAMIGVVVGLNQDLAVVGNVTGPIPGGGGGPRPGQEGIYALDLNAGLGPLAALAEQTSDACQ